MISLSQMKTPLTASCATDCSDQPLLFQDLGSRKVVADFSGGSLSSDGGVLLLREVDQKLGITRALAECFADGRDQRFVDHAVQGLLAQRTYGLALGYEDLNDHERRHWHRAGFVAGLYHRATRRLRSRCRIATRPGRNVSPFPAGRTELTTDY